MTLALDFPEPEEPKKDWDSGWQYCDRCNVYRPISTMHVAGFSEGYPILVCNDKEACERRQRNG